MFTLLSFPLMVIVYILAAALPSILLMRYIYRQDTVEKEPMGLLMSLLFFGVVAAIVAGMLEPIGQQLLSRMVLPGTDLHTVLLAFCVVAAIEEGVKFLFLKWSTWEDPNFNYRFDGIVYAVFLSLGFAAYENLQYVLRYGFSVALPRAVLAVPGHLAFAVIMGLFYSRAKLAQTQDHEMFMTLDLWWAWVVAVLLHGFYDACAMIGTPVAVGLFIGFVLFLYVLVYRLVKRESASDQPV